jgi:hypothetical protein
MSEQTVTQHPETQRMEMESNDTRESAQSPPRETASTKTKSPKGEETSQETTPSQTALSPHQPKGPKDEYTPAAPAQTKAIQTQGDPETDETAPEEVKPGPTTSQKTPKAEPQEGKSDEEKVDNAQAKMDQRMQKMGRQKMKQLDPEIRNLVLASRNVLDSVETAVKVQMRREMQDLTEVVSEMSAKIKQLDDRANEIEAAAKRADQATMNLQSAAGEDAVQEIIAKNEQVKGAVQEMCDDLIDRIAVLSEQTQHRFEEISTQAYNRISKKINRVEAFDGKLDKNIQKSQVQANEMLRRHKALLNRGEDLTKIPRAYAAVVLVASMVGGALGAAIFIAWETLF